MQSDVAWQANVSDLGPHFWTLHLLVVALGVKQAIELGVRKGASTTAILAGLDVTGGHLWSCDIASPQVRSYVREHPRWSFYLGDDRRVRSAGPKEADFLFIDTSHKRRHTEAELKIFGERIRPGGVIVLHDTELKEVREPAWAWAEAHDALFTDVPGSYGLGVIRV